VLYSLGRVVFESGSHETRIVFTDGRVLPDEAPLDFFNGTSVGHWDGDTLVVETIGVLPEVDLFPGIANGGGLKVSERIRLVGPDKLEDQITLTGAEIFTAPYTYTRTFTRHREWEVTDYVCLRTFNTSFGVGPKPSDAELKAGTTSNPPRRQVVK